MIGPATLVATLGQQCPSLIHRPSDGYFRRRDPRDEGHGLDFLFYIAGVWSGPHERRLINDLMKKYNNLERPVANESEALVLKFGLTLQQIIDVVSCSQRLLQ